MEENQQENANSDYPDTSENSSFSSEENPIHSNSEQVNTDDTNSDSSNKQCYTHPKIEINCTQDDNGAALKAAKKANRISKKSNKISRWGLLASIAVSVLTLIALVLTWDANRTTRKALSDAREKDLAASIREKRIDSLDSIVRLNDFIRDTTNMGVNKRALEVQQIATKNSNEMNEKTIAIAQQSFETQVNSLNEAQKRFDIENQPYLQVTNIKHFFIDPVNWLLQFAVELTNVSKNPAQIIEIGYWYKVSTNNPRFIPFDSVEVFKKLLVQTRVYNRYLIKETPITDTLGTPYFFSIPERTGGVRLDFYLRVRFKNITTGKDKFYRYAISIFENPARAKPWIEPMLNETTEN